VPIGWSVAEWIGDPLQELPDVVVAVDAIRARVLDRVDSGLEPDALLPLILDLRESAPAAEE